MARNAAMLLEPVRRELAALGHAVVDLRPLDTGLEFAVFRAAWCGRTVVVKAPWSRHISNDNDMDQDARDLLRQEAALLGFARSVQIPAPEVAFLHVEGNVDLLATAFVPSDGSSPSADELALTLATLHAAQPPTLALVAQPNTFAAVIAERVVRRARVIEQATGIRLRLPLQVELETMLSSADSRPSLLHLDVRSGNLLTLQGRIVGLVDWTNALVGDPGLELARIAEYGSAPTGFFAAYERRRSTSISRVCELVYRLDAAIMLAVVFLSEAPNAEQAARYLERTDELADALRWALAK